MPEVAQLLSVRALCLYPGRSGSRTQHPLPSRVKSLVPRKHSEHTSCDNFVILGQSLIDRLFLFLSHPSTLCSFQGPITASQIPQLPAQPPPSDVPTLPSPFSSLSRGSTPSGSSLHSTTYHGIDKGRDGIHANVQVPILPAPSFLSVPQCYYLHNGDDGHHDTLLIHLLRKLVRGRLPAKRAPDVRGCSRPGNCSRDYLCPLGRRELFLQIHLIPCISRALSQTKGLPLLDLLVDFCSTLRALL